jgi:hypothetical protein
MCTFHFTLIKLLYIIADIGIMDGMTLSEMSKELKVPVNTLRQRITRLGIKPLTKEAIYSRADFEKIRNVEMGRPKKAAEPEPAKPKAKKPAKPKE